MSWLGLGLEPCWALECKQAVVQQQHGSSAGAAHPGSSEPASTIRTSKERSRGGRSPRAAQAGRLRRPSTPPLLVGSGQNSFRARGQIFKIPPCIRATSKALVTHLRFSHLGGRSCACMALERYRLCMRRSTAPSALPLPTCPFAACLITPPSCAPCADTVIRDG